MQQIWNRRPQSGPRWGMAIGVVLVGLTLAGGGVAPAAAAKKDLAVQSTDRDLTVRPKGAAGSVPITGQYWALIIGIDRYQHAPKLESAVRDAQGVRAVLTARYGFTPEHLVELYDTQATRANIEEALYTLGRQAGKDDSVFIYYAGHGQYDEDGKLGWWVPVEAQPKNPGTFITNASIRDYITGMKARHVYLVADSCFSGTLFGTRALPPINDHWFARLYQKPSRWGLTSGGKEPVADRGKDGHSVFAYHLITLLTDNTDPYLVPSQIHHRLAPLVANNTDQTPQSEPLKGAGDEGGQFVFQLVAPGASPPSASSGESSSETAQLRAELEALKAQVNKSQPIEEARARPYEHPRSAPRELTGTDGASMVLVPGGQFWMGSSENDVDRAIEDCKTQQKKDEQTCRGWFAPEQPRHSVTLDPFYLDTYEVTNRLFDKFVRATGYQTTAEKEGTAFAWIDGKGWQDTSGATWRQPEAGPLVFATDRAHHPVVAVSWHDAEAYCRWAGKRLPTEAEFEYATRGGTQTKYWWGNGSPGTRRVANVADESAKNTLATIMTGYDDGSIKTAPVGSYDPNPFGLFDLTGNVTEWTADWFDGNYYKNSPERNPTGPSSGQFRVLRGGSWDFAPVRIRSADRDWTAPTSRRARNGFRCAQDAPK